MGRFSVIFAGTFGIALIASCSFQPKREAPGGMAGTTGTGTGTGGTTPVDDAAVFRPDTAIDYIIADAETDGGPSVDANCGNVPFAVATLPPELLIVLDRSGSMNENTAGMMLTAGDPLTKWVQVVNAIKTAVAASESKVNWGLKLFGTGTTNQGAEGCVVDNVVAVPPGPNNAAAIAAAMDLPANQPATSTPTRQGVMTAGTYLSTLTTPNPKFILLATDGEPNCRTANGGGNDPMGAVGAVAAAAGLGIETFVIGISAETVAGMTLDMMAMAGGRPQMGGTTMYYSVTTTDSLIAALGTIQAAVGMCTYPVGTQDPMTTDLTKISVMVDGSQSMRDAPDGWVYDPGMTSITFQGSTCDQLKAGTLKTVQILFGCMVGPVK